MPKGALALLMHASEMPNGNHWQKVVARKAIEVLGSEDYCGLLHYDGTDKWLWGGMIKVGGRKDRMLQLCDRMVPGDMPQFDPAMVKAERAFAQLTDAAAKHMIIISDGDPSPPSGRVIRQLINLKVTISTVAIGAHGPAESSLMRRIAKDTASAGRLGRFEQGKSVV